MKKALSNGPRHPLGRERHTAPRCPFSPVGSRLGKHGAGGSSVCSSAAPSCLCPQETSQLLAACWPERCSDSDQVLISISAAVQGRRRGAEHHGDAREKGRVLQRWRWGRSAAGKRKTRCVAHRCLKVSRVFYRLPGTGTSLQISVLAHPSANLCIWEQREEAGPYTSLHRPEFSLRAKQVNQYCI